MNSAICKILSTRLCTQIPTAVKAAGQSGCSSSWFQRGVASSAVDVHNGSNGKKRKTEMTFEELDAMMKDGNVSLIDVRLPCELQSYGEIPGSVNIPVSRLTEALNMSNDEWSQLFNKEKPHKRDQNLVFYSRGPNSSSTAVEIAHRLGYKGSRHYSGGWEEYCNKLGISLKKYDLSKELNGDQRNIHHISFDKN